MSKNYNEYKAWWIEYSAKYAGNLHPWAVSMNESDFEKHLNEMTHYELMETLSSWT